VTGESERAGFGSWDFCTIKYNTNGVQQWVARYNGPGNIENIARAIAVDGTGNVYVTGESTGIGSGLDYCTIKYNTNGDSLWVRRYNGTGNGDDFPHDVLVDNNGYVYVTGAVYDGAYLNYDCCTIKYSNDGIQQWVSLLNDPLNSGGRKVNIDRLQNIYVTGGIDVSGQGSNYLTAKYNSNGIQQWIAIYNGTGNSTDIPFENAIDSLGNVYITGRSYGGTATSEDYCTIKYNTNGDSLWVRRYDGPEHSYDDAYSIALDRQANVYVTGGSTSNSDGKGICTIKYNTNGVQQWLMRYNGLEGDFILLDKFNNVYVVGRQDINYNEIITTIKYSQPSGLQKISGRIPGDTKLYQNYPNPFNPATTIKYDLPKSGDVSIKIYDLLGKEIYSMNEFKLEGSYSFRFDGSNYASGVYFYKIEAGSYVDTKKMVLIK
jgi:hypothetical protein